jgi:hypothetical protein
MGQILIVSKDSDLLSDERTVGLHTYADGEVLVESAAPLPEDGGGKPAPSGLRLAGVAEEQLDEARANLRAPRPEVEVGDEPGEMLAYVELVGPVVAEWLEELERHGIRPLRYQPVNSYLCRGTRAAFQGAEALPFVLRVTPLSPLLKRGVPVAEQGPTDVWVVGQGDAGEAEELLAELASLAGVQLLDGTEVVAGQLRARAAVTAEGHANLLAHPRVLAVEPWLPAVPEDEVAGLVLAGAYDAKGIPAGSYLTWLEDMGLNGQGVTIGIVDNGVDETHVAFAGRVRSLDGDNRKWHGTFVAGHAAGRSLAERDGQGFVYGLGTAPAAELLTQDNSRTAAALCLQTVREPGPSGAPGTVQNNSWGMGLQDPMDYGSLEAAYDALVRNADPGGPEPRPLTICFSAGNSGQLGLTRPKAVKNAIVTGNSEVYRPTAGGDESDDISQVYSGSHGSSWGNCGDRRVRPDLVAPGEWTASANYDSHPGQREYISALHTWGGGTSAASPKTAGACALLTQWWRRNHAGATPSPAMLRALLVNGAVDTRTGGPIPNNRQGWGRLNLAGVLAEDVERMYVDQSVLLAAKGEQRSWTVEPSDPSRPVRITLAWTDPPGPVGGGTATVPAVVNRLGLRVEAAGSTWYANNFASGWSLAGPLLDPDREGLDNLQNIYLPAGVVDGAITVSVTALNVTTDCLSNQPAPPRQDFALVMQNARPASAGQPAEVAVAVDEPAGGEPSGPDDFWDDQPGSSDADEQDADWWWETEAAVQTGPESAGDGPDAGNGSATPNARASWVAAEGWWSEADGPAWPPAAEAAAADQTGQPLAEGLRAGLETLAAHADGQVVVAGPGPEPRDDLQLARLDLGAIRAGGPVSVAPGPLRTSLQRFRAEWGRPEPALGQDGQAPARRAAVVVVRGGSRFSRDDLAVLRLLAFTGQLWVGSDSAGALAFLAQRIGRRSGVRYRLAAGANQLSAALAEALAEAGGGQGVELASRVHPDDGQPARRSSHVFHLVAADRLVSIDIAWPAAEPAPQAMLRRPGRDPEAVTPGDASGLRVTRRDGRLRVTADRGDAAGSWTGRWELQLRQAGTAAEAAVAVSVSGDHRFRVARREVPGPESGAGSAERELVSVSGIDATRFNRLGVQRLVIGGGQGPDTEASVDVTIAASRLDLEARGATGQPPDSEAGTAEPAYAPSISAVAPAPRAPAGAGLVDLLLRTEGVDGDGNQFARRLRTNQIQLEPRSSWRRRTRQLPVLTPARVTQVSYRQGLVAGLRLAWGGRQRSVRVSSPELRDQLTGLDLGGTNLHFGMLGDELVTVLVVPRGADGRDTQADRWPTGGRMAELDC